MNFVVRKFIVYLIYERRNKLKVIPIVPNTGGIVSPEETVGRESEIAFYWETLEKQGIALFAERRFGKSSILRKMEQESPEGFITIYNPWSGLQQP